MPIESLVDFFEALCQYRLLPPQQLDEVTRHLWPRCQNPRALCRELLERDWLTPFQVNKLLQGRGASLVLGQYVLVERLGEGGMGRVFKARHHGLGRIVAIKIIRKERLTHPESVLRFQREVRAAAQLSHPNVVHAFDADQVGDSHFLVMEFVDGIDLYKFIRKSGTLPVEQACDFARQVALGLQHAHEQGLVHRDIKPHNLLVTNSKPSSSGSYPALPSVPSPANEQAESNSSPTVDLADPSAGSTSATTPVTQVKILDMGLARLNHPCESGSALSLVTREGVVMGTMDYIAPEQTMDAHAVDIRADLYSLGCTMYHMLTGRVPFPKGSATEKMLRHRREEPVPIVKLRPEVPAAVAAVIRKLMAKKPKDRYQTPAEAADVLARILSGAPDSSPAGELDFVVGPAGPNELGEDAHDVKAAIPLGAAPADIPATVFVEKPGSRRINISLSRRHLWGLLISGVLVLLAGGAILWACWSFWLRPATSPVNPVKEASPPVYVYVKKNNRVETICATLKANGYPTLEGKWSYIGPFDNTDKKAFDFVYPPEKDMDRGKTYPGKNGQIAAWKEYTGFQLGQMSNLAFFPSNDEVCVYLYHETTIAEERTLPVSLGSDDAIIVWMNGQKILSQPAARLAAPDQDRITLPFKSGKNQLLIKVCQGVRGFGPAGALVGGKVYLCPAFPSRLEMMFGTNLQRDFPLKP